MRRLFSRVALSVSILAFIATLFIVTAPAGHSPAATSRSAAVNPAPATTTATTTPPTTAPAPPPSTTSTTQPAPTTTVAKAAPKPSPTTTPPAPKTKTVAAVTPVTPTVAAANSTYGCAPALAYLASHSAPGFQYECPGYSLGHQAMTCIDVSGVCPGEKLIVITIPCEAAYMNEASNSWVLSGLRSAPIDPYGYCHT